jgi:hypothetical protein
MAESVSESSHPGLSVGPTSEFSLFFHVKPGQGPSLRSALAAVRTFVLGAEQTAAAYARNYGGTVKEIRKARRVNTEAGD